MADEKAVEVKSEEKKEEAKDEEKKPSGFSKWWKGTKDSINSNILEDHIKNAYREAHHEVRVFNYGETSIFAGMSEYGAVKDNIFTYFGTDELKPYSVIVDSLDNKAYYVLKSEKTTVKAVYDGQEYTRDGTKVTLDDKVEEVKVVKADKRYFLYKGDEKVK
jgi:hypothetical protein